jgi:hypothetical protein
MALIEQSPAKRCELKKGNLMPFNSASDHTINEGLMRKVSVKSRRGKIKEISEKG